MLAAFATLLSIAGQPGWLGPCQHVKIERRWHKIDLKFNARSYKRVRLYLRLQFATGTVWFDAVTITGPGAALANPSFEKSHGNRIDGWGQDDAGNTIFIDTSQAFDGRQCVRISRSTRGMSRIWQDIDVKPRQTYTVTAWAMWRDISGGVAYGEVYGINPDGTLGGIIGSSQHLRGSSTTETDEWWQLRAGNSAAAARWRINPPSPGCYQIWLFADPSAAGPAGIRLRLLSPAGRVLSEQVLTGDDWTSARFVAALEKQGAVVEAQVPAGAAARLQRVQLSRLQITPTPQRVRWLLPANNFALGPDVEIVVPEGSGGRAATAALWLRDRIAELCGAKVPIVPETQRCGRKPIFLGGISARKRLASVGLRVPEKPEGYALAVRANWVAVAGSDEVGTFYGAMTLLWLIQPFPDGPQVAAAEIEDWPDLPFRGTYGLYGDAQSAAELFALLKLNAVVMESGDFYFMDRPAAREKWQRIFATLRRFYLEPIPEIQSFGHGGCVLSINPNCAEGVYVQGERHKLSGTKPVSLNHRNVLITDATRITVTSLDGKTVYQEGRDFRVIPGVTKYPFRDDAKPWAIARIDGGRIPDGAEVLVSYDYAPRGTKEYCPNEPQVYEIMRRAIQGTIRALHPRYVHIGHDEIYRMNRDSRCKRAGRSNAQNLAADLLRLLQFARECDPKVKIMLWADMLNPYHNGRRFFHGDWTYHAADMLPPDGFVMNIWFYGRGQAQKQGWWSLQFFDQRGFATTGSPWYNADNAREWAEVCAIARRRGMNCWGVLYTSWSGRWHALATMADHAWNARGGVEVVEPAPKP